MVNFSLTSAVLLEAFFSDDFLFWLLSSFPKQSTSSSSVNELGLTFSFTSFTRCWSVDLKESKTLKFVSFLERNKQHTCCSQKKKCRTLAGLSWCHTRATRADNNCDCCDGSECASRWEWDSPCPGSDVRDLPRRRGRERAQRRHTTDAPDWPPGRTPSVQRSRMRRTRSPAPPSLRASEPGPGRCRESRYRDTFRDSLSKGICRTYRSRCRSRRCLSSAWSSRRLEIHDWH